MLKLARSNCLDVCMRIGVFDSGLGGLAVLKEILKTLPQYDFIYLGDNARVPYGGRSQELIYQYTSSAIDFLFDQGCLLIILACNVATASALRKLQKEYLPQKFPNRRILGVIRPAVEEASIGAKRIGILGTYTTIESQSFVRELKKISPNIHIFQQACPLLVPIIEEGETDWEGLDSILDKYLKTILRHDIDTLILACTHYELIEKKIRERVSGKIKIISEGKVVKEKLKTYLIRHPRIEKKLEKKGTSIYYVTDLNDRYQQLAGRILSLPKVSLRLAHL